jgi:hypothetical protein
MIAINCQEVKMFKSSKWIVLVSIVLVLSYAWQPVAAMAAQPEASSALVKLVINNQTSANIYLSLSGASSYYFTLGAGKTSVEVLKGKYQFRYLACGATQTGTLEIKKANQKFVLKKCAAVKGAKSKPANTVKVTMINQTGGTMTIVLTGPTTYRFTVQSGKSQILVAKGKYSYTGYTVCGTNSGKLNIRSNGRWRWRCY